MGLFDKKYCDVCGDKIGLLGNRKLADGNLCKNCAKKLSPWFDERRHSTVEQIKNQLAYREENRAQAAAFHKSRVIGNGRVKVYLDEAARKFAVTSASNFAEDNPDILDFSQAIGIELNIDEHRDELYRMEDGNSESYNPPRYEYSYDFEVTIRVNHPYFDDMKFELNSGSVDTGERCMTQGNTSAWNVNLFGGMFNGGRGQDEYQQYVEMGNELKAMIDSWHNGGQPGTGDMNAAPQAPQQTYQQTPQQPQAADWTCAYCGTVNTGNFCTGCGAKRE